MASPMPTEDRKRPLHHLAETEDRDGPRKRLHADSPHVAQSRGSTVDTEGDDPENLNPAYKGLEAFRKEAIYRKLLESRRDLYRTRSNLRTLNQDLQRSEQSTSLLQRFWTLLLEDVRSRVAVDDAAEPVAAVSLDLRADAEAIEAQLQGQSSLILSLLTRHASTNHDQGSKVVQLQQRCHDLADEAARFKQELFLTQSKLERAEHTLSETSQKLIQVEREHVRLQSHILNPNLSKAPSGDAEAAPAPASGTLASTDKAVKREGSSTPQTTTKDAEVMSAEILEQLEKARSDLSTVERESDGRYAEIQGQNEEIKALKLQLHQLQSQADQVPEDKVAGSASYKGLVFKIKNVQDELRLTRERLESLEAENSDLRDEYANHQKKTEIETKARVEELEKAVKLKDADVARLRGQRDELQAELTERRQREQVKFTQIEEMKGLVNTKEERLEVLNSQVKRLRLTVAALRGEQAAITALKEGGSEADQIERLGNVAKVAELQVAELRRKLESHGAEDSNGISDGSKSKEEDLAAQVSKLRSALDASEASSNALCDEIDRLSTAYSELEREASTKVLDISRAEDKTLKLITEKAKADNKYFSAMRSKESIEAEKRAAVRNVERQTKIIDLMTENEKTFAGQLKLQEKELSAFRRSMDAHAKKIAELESELQNAQMRAADALQARAQASDSAKDLISTATEEKNARKRIEERILRLEKDLEQAKWQAAKAVAHRSGSKSRKGSEAAEDAEIQGLRAMLECSACKSRYRSKIITKCYHTFCAPCIDMRIQTRQRKCPHCGLSFSNSDVQTLYMQ